MENANMYQGAVRVGSGVGAALHHGPGRDGLTLCYQPIGDTGSEEIVAGEALVRWEHPTRGLLLPGTFIPLAEEAGLMDPIGARVLHDACLAAAAWNGPGRPPVAVNVIIPPGCVVADGGAIVMPAPIVTVAVAVSPLASVTVTVSVRLGAVPAT